MAFQQVAADGGVGQSQPHLHTVLGLSDGTTRVTVVPSATSFAFITASLVTSERKPLPDACRLTRMLARS
jgi:hypothetical protein